ncbi:MAG TPA: ATP-grasp domain-containing protein [Methanocella sp.]|nr:ATP-grasp domain-containing protein [Methanocella sp.]
MKVMLAEYSVCTGMEASLQIEGAAMLKTLKTSFESTGCTVITPEDFKVDFRRKAEDSDCGLVIAPDEILADYTEMLESACINLGSSPAAIRLCADKKETTELLLHNGLSAPRIVTEGRVKCVVKPRMGCGSEDIFVSVTPVQKDGYISTEYVEGDHLSVSLVAGKGWILPLTLNRQHIQLEETIEYNGNDVNIPHPATEEIFRAAVRAGAMAGCRGFFGVDVVYGDRPYIVDINPRPTTSIVGVASAIDRNLADLILMGRFSMTPPLIRRNRSFSFTKKDLEGFI